MESTDNTLKEETGYMTVPEAARYLGVGRKVVYQLIELQRVRVVRKKQNIMVAKESVEEFKRSRQLT
jgi:excisionase family DNA binding protein